MLEDFLLLINGVLVDANYSSILIPLPFSLHKVLFNQVSFDVETLYWLKLKSVSIKDGGLFLLFFLFNLDKLASCNFLFRLLKAIVYDLFFTLQFNSGSWLVICFINCFHKSSIYHTVSCLQ